MTEYNLFCFSKKYGDENSIQQPRYRAFNKDVGKSRYYEIKNAVAKILGADIGPNPRAFWKQITSDQWRELLEIPEAKDFKEGFEFISGVKIADKVKITIDGKEIWISKETADQFRKL